MFIIEDERHAEWIGEYGTRDEAIAELQRLSRVPWNEAPNLAPCTSWRTCGRSYELVEYDDVGPSCELGRTPALNVSQQGVEWLV